MSSSLPRSIWADIMALLRKRGLLRAGKSSTKGVPPQADETGLSPVFEGAESRYTVENPGMCANEDPLPVQRA